MCGIVGIINHDNHEIDSQKLHKMNDILTHRGPDFGDVFIDGNVGLGHRRLSILDLSAAANQPMNYKDSDYWIVFNGEVYNYIELKEELIEKGYDFSTDSDTEVVLAAYIEWGEDCFHKFNGMWALAIYDVKGGGLLLCRDRFGVKPLYYYNDEHQFLFASEKKAIVLSDFVSMAFDTAALKAVIKDPMAFESTGDTEFKGVKNLLPGHLLKITKDAYEVSQWYCLMDHLDKDVPTTLDARCDKFKQILMDACKLRLRADVPIATSLSGGLDSSSIVAILSEIDDLKHEAFVHSFEGSFLDETKYAKIVADTTKTPLHDVNLRGQPIQDDIDEVLYYFEAVYGGMPDAPFRIYREQRKQGYKISIDGHGADEMLAGYGWYLDARLKDIPLYNLFEIWRVFNHKDRLSKNVGNKTVMLMRLVFDRLPGGLKNSIKVLIGRETQNEAVERRVPEGFSNLKKQLYIDFSYTVLPRILKNFEAISMANSIEVRMPFLDYRLVQYAFSLPDEDLIHQGWTKFILRESMEGLLDKQVNWRKDKIGFNSPVSDLMGGELKQWTLDVIHASDETLFLKKELLQEFKADILDHPNWNASLSFWKKIHALKFIEIYKEKKLDA